MSEAQNMSSSQRTQDSTASGHHKTVPLPRSLPELRQAAELHFKTDGRMRLFHLNQDGKEMHHPASVSNLKDGDIVHIKVDKGRSLGVSTMPVCSTHHSDFVARPSSPAKATMDDSTSCLTEANAGAPFQGKSCYALDYTRYPPTPRRGPLGASALYGQHFLKHAGEAMPKSSYDTHFLWPHAKAAASAGSDDASVLTAASKGHRFDARTSYNDDYAPQARWQLEAPPQALGNDNASTLTDAVMRKPFEGMSSYQDHYIKHPHTGRQPSARPENGTPRERPFGGTSEYQQQYADRNKRPPMVHLKRIY